MKNAERLADLLPSLLAVLTDEEAGEILSFAEFIAAKHNRRHRPPALDPESQAWMDADLSRMSEIEPYDWGPDGPPKGKPIVWNAESGRFVIVGGRDEPT